jgi:hypothetical protein
MSSQKGKTHNYPSSRKPYERSRSGVGGRPKKGKAQSVKTKATYFDLLKEKQSGQGAVPVSSENEEANASTSKSDPPINISDATKKGVVYAIETSLLSLGNEENNDEILEMEEEIQEIDDNEKHTEEEKVEAQDSEEEEEKEVEAQDSEEKEEKEVEAQDSEEEEDEEGEAQDSEEEEEEEGEAQDSEEEEEEEGEAQDSEEAEEEEEEEKEEMEENLDLDDNEDESQMSESAVPPGSNNQNYKKASFIQMQHDFSWLYYDAVNSGYKCKLCELFPEGVTFSNGKNKFKFSHEAVKDLSDHPKRTLKTHESSKKHQYAVRQYEEFRTRQSLECLERSKESKEVREAKVTHIALEKLLRITVFMVKKHWAHIQNYGDFVNFIGKDLEDLVLSEYLKLAGNHKNATYLSKFTVKKFVQLIGDFIEKETIETIKRCEHFTILLDESTDDANRSELALIARIVDEKGVVQNHFLTLIQLKRCDAVTIFTAVNDYLKKKEIDITRICFSGMDGCSTMLGEHKGVSQHFKRNCSHHSSIHCRNHRLALCFSHLIPWYKPFENFDGLLLNLFLLLKHSTVKASIFDEVQRSYNLESLKLIKAATTRWLSHGKASQRVLDRFEPLIDALIAIHERKKEPAVKGLLEDLTEPETVATLCFLSDVMQCTNSFQVFLQHARLNFLDLPGKVKELTGKLDLIKVDPRRPNSNFKKLEEFLDVAAKQERLISTRSRSASRSQFSKENFTNNVIKPFISDLIQEIERSFEIPSHLKGFTAFDPQNLPIKREDLEEYGNDSMQLLSDFYGVPYEIGEGHFHPKVINAESLKIQFSVFKTFAFVERFEYESKQRKCLEAALRERENLEQKLKSLNDLLTVRKQNSIKQQIKSLDNQIGELRKTQKITFEIVLKRWYDEGLQAKHSDISKMLEFAALIPPSTAEVERAFSLMKLICTRLRRSLAQVNLAHCMRISKFRELAKEDYQKIIKIWLAADDTKSKKRRISNRLRKSDKC